MNCLTVVLLSCLGVFLLVYIVALCLVAFYGKPKGIWR